MKWMMTTTAVLKEDKLYQIDPHGEMDLTRKALQSIRDSNLP